MGVLDVCCNVGHEIRRFKIQTRICKVVQSPPQQDNNIAIRKRVNMRFLYYYRILDKKSRKKRSQYDASVIVIKKGLLAQLLAMPEKQSTQV